MAEDDPGALQHVGARCRPWRPAASKSASAIEAPSPAPALDRDLGAERDELLDGLGDRGAARLARRLLQDRDLHPAYLQDQRGRRSR